MLLVHLEQQDLLDYQVHLEERVVLVSLEEMVPLEVQVNSFCVLLLL